MILIFDLDDTLYDEMTFVKSGFKAVAQFLKNQYGLSSTSCYLEMLKIFKEIGRGHVFDVLLEANGIFSSSLVRKCICIYRLHDPQIRPYSGVRTLLHRYSKFGLYLVTDGNKIVQANKLKALKIAPFFKKIFITHRYGLHHAKPSTYCFKRIRELEQCPYSDMVYVADNPKKDFVNVRKLGLSTVRVLTGLHAHVKATREFDAEFTIPKVTDLDPNHLIQK